MGACWTGANLTRELRCRDVHGFHEIFEIDGFSWSEKVTASGFSVFPFWGDEALSDLFAISSNIAGKLRFDTVPRLRQHLSCPELTVKPDVQMYLTFGTDVAVGVNASLRQLAVTVSQHDSMAFANLVVAAICFSTLSLEGHDSRKLMLLAPI